MKHKILLSSFLLALAVGFFFSCSSSETKTLEPESKGVAVTGISLDKSTLSLKVGNIDQLKATISPSDADDKGVTWSSSAEAVATVSSTGEVTAIKLGTATITVASKEDSTKTATATITVISGATPPSKPETLTASIKRNEPTTVVLSWTAPSNAGKAVDGVKEATITAYELTFLPPVSGIAQPIALGAGARFSEVSDLTPGNNYVFTLKAKNIAGLGSGREILRSVASAISAPGAPANLVATASGIATTRILLVWGEPSNKGKNTDGTTSSIKSYVVTYTDGISTKNKPITTGTPLATATALTDLKPGTTYIITVRAINTAGETSPPSNQITPATTSAATTPAAPTNLAVTTSGITTMTMPLTWNAPSNEGKNTDGTTSSIKAYNIIYTDGSTGTGTKIITGTPPATSATLTSLRPQTQYTITVTATNTANKTSVQSDPILSTTISVAANTSIVTFNYNYSGGPTATAQTIVNGKKAIEETAPTRSGYTFKGWNSQSNGGGSTFNFETTITTDLSLFAKWEIITYMVTFNSNYTGAPNPATKQSVETGKKAIKPKDPIRSGYTFKGWNSQSDGSGSTFNFEVMTITGDLALYAKWVEDFTVSFNYNYNGSPAVENQMVASGDKAKMPTPAPAARLSSYKIKSWNSKQNGSGDDYNFETPITGHLTLYAQWTYYPVNRGELVNLLFTQNIDPAKIDTRRVTDMSELFKDKPSFNGDISSWDVSNVVNMKSMFKGATIFNRNLSKWKTSRVTDMSNMFDGAAAFNSDISSWNVSSVTGLGMESMFAGAAAFNTNISSWDVSGITSMNSMFYGAKVFNGDISSWNVSSVTTMSGLFNGTATFNVDLSRWNVSSVTNMYSMFQATSAFNQNIGGWNVSKVTNMAGMFSSAKVFNQNIGGWNVSKVTNMLNMFRETLVFNQNIGGWKVSSITNIGGMFYNAKVFNQNLNNWSHGTAYQTGDLPFDGSPLESAYCKLPKSYPTYAFCAGGGGF